MVSHSLKFALLAVILLGLVIPTGAVVTGAVDDVFEENGVVLKPYDGPNGQYADIGDDGELSVETTDPGVNNEGITVVRQVFTIENRGSQPATVWLTHDATGPVTLYENVTSGVLDASGIASHSIQGAANQSTLRPGERVVVSLAINTNTGGTAVNEPLLERISLHVQQETETPTDTETPTEVKSPTPTEPETPTPTETPAAGQPQQTEAPTPTETPPETPTGNETEEVEVRFDMPDLANESVTVRDVDPVAVPESGDSDPDPRPQAVISRQQDGAQQGVNESILRLQGADTVVTTGEETTLDASLSTIDRTDGVDRQRRIVKASDISPREGLEQQSATIRMRVSREKLGNTAPENARIGHMTNQGWQLLETSVVSETSESVLLEAKTPGFSLFAVFANPEVTYEWTLPNGTVVQGSSVRSSFSEPGFYNVTLTVTDALGNSNSTQHRILANDVPSVTIDAPENASVDQQVQLVANVSNEYGNTTVTWALPNGSEVTGRTVNYTIQDASPQFEATVVDEYGANATATATIQTGDAQAGAEQRQSEPIVGDQFPLLNWLFLIGSAVLFLMIVHRLTHLELRAPSGWLRSLVKGRGRPHITRLENPSWDQRRGRFEIERLRVEAAKGVLETVEISMLTAEGTEVARKTIDIGTLDVYEASPEFIHGIRSASIDPAQSYSVRVRAVDSQNRERLAITAIQVLTPFQGSGL